MNISIRLANSLGCSVAGTAIIHSVKSLYPHKKINVITKTPSLLEGIKRINIIQISSDNEENIYDIDLRKYTARRPHNNKPYRPSYIHMFEMAEEQLKIKLPRYRPHLVLDKSEKNFASNEIRKYPHPLIWIQTKSNSSNREWPTYNWDELICQFRKTYSFIDLSNAGYTLRQSLAITTVSSGGICLDSFLVHGSAAVGAKSVIVLLGSSRAECVTYSGQHIISSSKICAAQPCAMHGYYPGCKITLESLFTDRNCIFETAHCMECITVPSVALALEQFSRR